MAVRKNATSKLTLKVMTGVDDGGAKTYAQRTVANVNPALTDDEARSIGEKIASLQEYELESVSRTDAAQIAAE